MQGYHNILSYSNLLASLFDYDLSPFLGTADSPEQPGERGFPNHLSTHLEVSESPDPSPRSTGSLQQAKRWGRWRSSRKAALWLAEMRGGICFIVRLKGVNRVWYCIKSCRFCSLYSPWQILTGSLALLWVISLQEVRILFFFLTLTGQKGFQSFSQPESSRTKSAFSSIITEMWYYNYYGCWIIAPNLTKLSSYHIQYVRGNYQKKKKKIRIHTKIGQMINFILTKVIGSSGIWKQAMKE